MWGNWGILSQLWRRLLMSMFIYVDERPENVVVPTDICRGLAGHDGPEFPCAVLELPAGQLEMDDCAAEKAQEWWWLMSGW
jgi:hypothetical protein